MNFENTPRLTYSICTIGSDCQFFYLRAACVNEYSILFPLIRTEHSKQCAGFRARTLKVNEFELR